jgi:hypothetical protein
LDEDGAAIALVSGRRSIAGGAVSGGTVLFIAAAIAAIVAVATLFSRRAVVAVG